MQYDQSKISSLQKADRTRNARTPDRLDVRNMDASMLNTFSPRRKQHTSRLSATLNTSNASLRKLELENNNLEIELAYSEFVALQAELIIENKLLKDTETAFSISIKNLYKETKSLFQNYKLIETRIADIKALTCLNDYIELIQLRTNHFKDLMNEYEIEKILLDLKNSLKRFNVLPCDNIILPSNTEEVQQLKKTLTNCYTILQQITDPEKSHLIDNIAVEYQEFKTLYDEIVNVKAIIQEKIQNFQSEVLKTSSHALSKSNH